MRSVAAIALALGVPISVGYVVACGAPDSFDGLIGGTSADASSEAEASIPLVEDATLEAPRAVAPLSGSWINGSRPLFRWQPQANGAVGAQVVVCADASCSDPARTKRWTASGRELRAPEDLPPGRYFWHVVSTTTSTVGTKTSATWSMRVRGGAGAGVPGGAFVDLNGDGISDLVVTADLVQGGQTFYEAIAILGSSLDDPTALFTDTDLSNPSRTLRDYPVGRSANLAIQSVDVDGDGRSDLVFSDIGTPGQAQFFAFFGTAGYEGPSLMNTPLLPGLDVIPHLDAPGDIDGDGHGDVLVGTKRTSMVVFGASDGIGGFAYVDQLRDNINVDAGELPPPTVPVAIAGNDLDNDGRVDIAHASYYQNEGFYLTRLNEERAFALPEVLVVDDAGVSTPATRFAFGDIDGDGTNDTAFATTSNGKPAVCIVTHASSQLGEARCWVPETAPAGFASALATVDLEGDGKDEVLVGAAGGGIDVLRLGASGAVEVERLAEDFGTSFTVLDPGRPLPAVWAATRADGTAIAVYRGKEQARLVTPSDVSGVLGFQIPRFQAGIR